MSNQASASEKLPGWSPPEGWPAMSIEQAKALLTAPGQVFEMEEVDRDGRSVLSWKNIPPHLRALVVHARQHDDREFVIYEGDRVTYEGFARAVASLAAHFASLGVEKGDRVALAMRNMPEWPVTFFAAASVGAIVVPLNAWWKADELCFALEDSGSKILVCDEERLELMRTQPCPGGVENILVCRAGEDGDALDSSCPAPVALESVIGACADYASLDDIALPDCPIDPDDEAVIFYTSGTTGKPKGALGTHRNMCTNILSSSYPRALSALRRGEMPKPGEHAVGLLVIPLFHVTACSASMMTSMFVGNTLVFMYKWDTVEAFKIIEREKVAQTGGVPFIAWELLEHPDRDKYDLSSLEMISYGGAPAAPELVRRIYSEFGALPGSGWGMSETMATVTYNPAEDYLARPESCGPAVPVAKLKIMSEDGAREMPTGETGELWAYGPMVVKGYWNRPEATVATFVDGWVRTGDIAKLDEDGFCTIVDRAKDVIIRGGENIYSSEVENVLYEHPAVIDAALIGIPHKTLGEEPVAVVTVSPDVEVDEAELCAFVKAKLASFKVPTQIKLVDEMLERNANGKILKGNLKALFE